MIRDAVRALVIDPDDRVLLVRFVEQGSDETWWATPGGGLDGQPPEAALRRELLEETGLEEFEPGPAVWKRRHAFTWEGRELDQRETFVLVRTPAFEPSPSVDLDAEAVAEIRWWTLDELERSDAKFAPRRLPALLRELLTEGPPPEPVDVGV